MWRLLRKFHIGLTIPGELRKSAFCAAVTARLETVWCAFFEPSQATLPAESPYSNAYER